MADGDAIQQARNLHRYNQKLAIHDDAEVQEVRDPETGEIAGHWVEAWKRTSVWVELC